MKLYLTCLVLAASYAVNGATIEKRVTASATAVQYTDPVANAYCLSGDVPADVVSRTNTYVNIGWYAAIPGPINVTDCAQYVAVKTTSGQANVNIVGATTDGTVKLSAAPWASLVKNGASSIAVTYTIAYD